ncbi:hypothetical protein CONCODRAFT_98511 [Conidiobolus coronatus NRRL 28638]|uniref:Uncharacterized protein n=1 Tax=Conidiobolus coronatus (strain ATCC 28846 / CBS 209.66 / NRRL 28638) TaxID=796925 RepID=A0A137P298_CONC2|nr:hypothetical protein CONCODRAFT_98511 [Conidiobolus coronatus NRRL 28638]|eukprot:KXN69170.1 hypothetical protein CONCODRAFT_98511 [Conidiobolus coronatus NRRL 28638]
MSWYGFISPCYLIAPSYPNSYKISSNKLTVEDKTHYTKGLKFGHNTINDISYLHHNDKYFSISDNGINLTELQDLEGNLDSLVMLEVIRENFFKLKNMKGEYLTINLERCLPENSGIFQFMDVEKYQVDDLELDRFSNLITSNTSSITNEYTSVEGINLLSDNSSFYIICDGELNLHLAGFDRYSTNDYPLLFLNDYTADFELKIELINGKLSLYWSIFGRLVIDYYDEHDTDTAMWSNDMDKELLFLEPSQFVKSGYYLRSRDYYVQTELINNYTRSYLMRDINDASIFQFKFIY